jgi:hypothetical protein
MVLDNLEMIRQQPEALPWHLKITQGGIGITDSANPSFTFGWPTISRSAEISATRQWAVSWTVVPVQDRDILAELSERYQSEAKDSFDMYYEEGSTAPQNPLVPVGKFGPRTCGSEAGN